MRKEKEIFTLTYYERFTYVFDVYLHKFQLKKETKNNEMCSNNYLVGIPGRLGDETMPYKYRSTANSSIVLFSRAY